MFAPVATKKTKLDKRRASTIEQLSACVEDPVKYCTIIA